LIVSVASSSVPGLDELAIQSQHLRIALWAAQQRIARLSEKDWGGQTSSFTFTRGKGIERNLTLAWFQASLRFRMASVLVLYYSSYGHIEAMAEAVAGGARGAGTTVDIKRVTETTPMEIARAANFKLDQPAPIAVIEDLARYDAIIVGGPTRFGRMCSQMASFLDQAGGLWVRGTLKGKVGGAFTSTASQHGGQEVTLFSIIVILMHLGMTIVGLPYSHQGQTTLDEIVGGTPYGASTVAGAAGQRFPSALDLAGARHQGMLIAHAAQKLST
jgi:NAD(P)H dehydrogenase (quinone)